MIFEKYRSMEKFIGFDPLGGKWNTISRTINLILFASFNMMEWSSIVSNIHAGLERAVLTVATICGAMPILICYIHLLISREHYHSLLIEMQDIVNKRVEKDGNTTIYAKAEQRCTTVTTIAVWNWTVAPIFTLSPFILVAYQWCVGTYTTDSWFFWFPVWTPFEMNTTVRCALIALYETVYTISAICVVYAIIIILFGLMAYMEACLLDIATRFAQVNHLSKGLEMDRKKLNPLQHKIRELLMLDHCKDAVDLHGRLNRCMHGLADLMNAIFLATITFFTICICGVIFVIEKYTGNAIMYDLQMEVYAVFITTTNLFVFFYLGQLFHSKLMGLSDQVYQMEWYRYPRSVQRFVQLTIMRSQKPFYLSAYGITTLDLNGYVRLLKWIYSAYMLLRRFD